MSYPWGLYIHIPFCRAKCSYCAFVSQVGDANQYSHYVAALCREIMAGGGVFNMPEIDTVFFGGGTPTVLATEELLAILEAVRNSFVLLPNAEISLEANPGTVDCISLTQLRTAGFNRLSLGVQSFDNVVLKKIGRIHDSQTACKAFEQAREAGFNNISLDLMYGLPAQSSTSWRDTLLKAVTLHPDHLAQRSQLGLRGTRPRRRRHPALGPIRRTRRNALLQGRPWNHILIQVR